MSKNDARPAIKDLIDAIRSVFKKYTRETREKSWKNGIQSADGKNTIDKLIKNPNVPIIAPYKLLKFKEFVEQQKSINN